MPSCKPQIKIPATYMRGGTSKGVFFKLSDLPKAARQAGAARDKILLRIIGSPDPYGKHTDGMGGATSSTSKIVILSPSSQTDHDIDYLFGQVAIDRPFIDWSGNCGNLTAAVGAFAISSGLIDANKIPKNGVFQVKIWQANIHKTIIAHIPICDGQVQETGDFALDGVTFPAAEVKIEFINPVGDAPLFPTNQLIEELSVPQIGTLQVTMISAGIPTIFVRAEDVHYNGTELQGDINTNPEALAMFEKIRAYGALKMGLIDTIEQAQTRQHTPKVAIVGTAKSYTSSSGKFIQAQDIDLNVRALSMGVLHHAMMGTAAVAIATAAAIPGTLVNLVAGGGERQTIRFGHPSGSLTVGAQVHQIGSQWKAEKVVMSRSARTLMQGHVFIPDIT